MFLPVSKRVEANPDWIAKLANADGLEHARVPQLGKDNLFVKVHRSLVDVRFDTTHKPWSASVEWKDYMEELSKCIGALLTFGLIQRTNHGPHLLDVKITWRNCQSASEP